MLRQQSWTPDTHPAYTFYSTWDDEPVFRDVEVTDAETGEVSVVQERVDPVMACIRCTMGAIEMVNPQALYDAVILENQMKNDAERIVISLLPDWMWRDVIRDGQPVYIDDGGVEVSLAGNGKFYRATFTPDDPDKPATYELVDPALVKRQREIIPIHTPIWKFGVADGKVSFSIFGADEDVLAPIREALAGYGDAVSVG